MKLKKYYYCLLVLLITTGALAGGVQLYGVHPFDGDSTTFGGLYTIDQQTGEFTSVVSITESGDFKETIAMALDTADNETVYVVFETDGTSGNRDLGTLDLSTGVITSIGPLGDAIADIAFDAMGQLYGVTGDGGTDSKTFFSIDKATGTMTLRVVMPDAVSNADGEALAYNFTNGMMYRISGNGTEEMTTIDLGTFAINTVPVTTSIANNGEGLSLLYDIDSGLFIGSDRDDQLVSIDPNTAEKGLIGADPGSDYLRGLMYFPSKQDLIFYDGFDTTPTP